MCDNYTIVSLQYIIIYIYLFLMEFSDGDTLHANEKYINT